MKKKTADRIAALQSQISELGFDEELSYCKVNGWILMASAPKRIGLNIHQVMTLGKSLKKVEEFFSDVYSLESIKQFSAHVAKEVKRTLANQELLKDNDNIAAVQASFESKFWVHSDPETIVKFAEKSVCGRLNLEYEIRGIENAISSKSLIQKVTAILEKAYEDSIEDTISSRNIVYFNRNRELQITREQAISFVGKESIMVKDFTHGSTADIFTIKETREQVNATQRFTASFEVKKIE